MSSKNHWSGEGWSQAHVDSVSVREKSGPYVPDVAATGRYGPRQAGGARFRIDLVDGGDQGMDLWVDGGDMCGYYGQIKARSPVASFSRENPKALALARLGYQFAVDYLAAAEKTARGMLDAARRSGRPQWQIDAQYGIRSDHG